MGKKLVFIFSCLVLLILFLLIGYSFGFSISQKIDNIKLSEEIFKKAQFEYKSADYANTIKYLEVANDIFKSNAYDLSIDSVKKIRNLNSLIEKNPNNYKLFIERGDLQTNAPINEPVCCPLITLNYCQAVNDYTQALKLNSNANEVYYKRAKAYIGCKKGVDFKNDIIKDFEKAISFSNTNEKDKITEQFADWYLAQDDAVSALKYYSKVENDEDNEKDNLPSPWSSPFSLDTWGNVLLKKVVCYDKLKDYESILNLLDEITNETDNKIVFEKANNLKFYYNLKTKNFKNALDSADNCSAMICEIVSFLHFKR